MRLTYFKYIINSIFVKLLCLIIFTVGPVAGLMFYNNMNSRQVLVEQVNDTHRNMLQNYVLQMDDQLSSALAYVLNLVLNENDTQLLAFGSEHTAKQYAVMRTKNALTEKLLSDRFIDGYFILANPGNESEVFINVPNSQNPATPGEVLKDYSKEYIEKGISSIQWDSVYFNNDEYLFVMASFEEGLYSGSYVRISHLLQCFEPGSVPGSALQLLSESSLKEYADGLEEDMQMVSFPSIHAGLIMVETFSQRPILESLPFLQKYTIAISVAMAILIVLLILVTQKIVIIPLFKLAMGMQHIQDNDLEYRLPQDHTSSEMHLVNDTFNHMAGQIKNLRINVYEEQLKVQKSQLRNLQMQIKPHFLINSLNMIHNLNSTGKIMLANQLILHTIDYFRYMIRVDEDLVPLTEELEHIRAYLEIQSIRYQDHFQYVISVDPMITDMLVPPVILQNFVENSIKYALSLTETLQISVQVTSFEKDYYPYAKIRLSDSGPGYPAEELEQLNAGDKIIKKDGEHIGIRNTTQRLKILFGDQASYHFYNDNGAVCEYILPATFQEFDEEVNGEEV